LKLLIIEDEPSLLESIKQYFTEEGSICETSGDMASALEKISIYNYDCILLDVGLPDGDGLKLLEKIKILGKEEGVIIISARNSLDDKVAGLNYGADDYLVKPFQGYLPYTAGKRLRAITCWNMRISPSICNPWM
jgi:DNA-binding response OmpR family regulator